MVFLSSDLLRLRFRDLPRQPSFATPGEPFELELNRFRFVTRTLAAGSRLRLTVRNAYSVLLGKNPHTGAGGGADGSRTATFRLLHDVGAPPVLTFPVVTQS